jgi:undecaprenyl pyrophosphate phosphatase UppP
MFVEPTIAIFVTIITVALATILFDNTIEQLIFGIIVLALFSIVEEIIIYYIKRRKNNGRIN